MNLNIDPAIGSEVDWPEGLSQLWTPARYKAAFGGRGGAKSHFFCEMLVLRCFAATTRAVCIREVQLSLKESVRQLLIDKIQKFGLGGFFEVLDAEIRGANGSLIIFKGMQTYNAETIKSLEGYDVAFVEEGQTLSERSLRLLRPTIRKEQSEIWVAWNPRYDTDPVDMFFRGAMMPPNATVVPVNWSDNPWFPSVLMEEKDFDYAADPEMAAHVWGGEYEIITEGAYYARQIAKGAAAGRIGYFPHDPDLPVDTAWDIGVDDYTAVWFIQRNGLNVRVIDFCEFSGVGPEQVRDAYLPELNPDQTAAAMALVDIGRPTPYRFGEHFFPHDAKVREWGMGGKTRVQTLYDLGFKNMRVGVAVNPADRVNAVRRLLPFTSFNQGPDPDRGVNLGLSHLRKYKRRFNESLGVFLGPLKDGNDHAADAFGEYAINCHISAPKPQTPKPPKQQQKKDQGLTEQVQAATITADASPSIRGPCAGFSRHVDIGFDQRARTRSLRSSNSRRCLSTHQYQRSGFPIATILKSVQRQQHQTLGLLEILGVVFGPWSSDLIL
jgi:phage terminase large subunit